jgi:membrane-bound metal-dependent hydrolase YbcI (DUF457 family)
MFAVGHFALGYLGGKLSSKILNVKFNLPLLFLASVFPDFDILFPFLQHRGPLHSIVVLCLAFVPIFLLFRARAVPYFVAVISHGLVGDFLTGGLQVFWPLSTEFFGLAIGMYSLTNVVLESSLFVLAIGVLFKTNDVILFFSHNSSNLFLSIPVMTVLMPVVLSFPVVVPFALLIPHIFWVVLFGFSILVDLRSFLMASDVSLKPS